MHKMQRKLLAAGLGIALAYGSVGPAYAEDISISPAGPSGIIVTPIERLEATDPQPEFWTSPGNYHPSQAQNSGGPLDNNIGTGHASYSSGDSQGDISENLSNEGFRFQLDDDDSNDGQANDAT